MFNGLYQSLVRMFSHVNTAIDKQRDEDIANGTYQPTKLSKSIGDILHKLFIGIKWFFIIVAVWFGIIAFMALLASGG